MVFYSREGGARTHKGVTLYKFSRFALHPARSSLFFEEDRVIETRTVARTPGVQTQFATLTVPSIFVILEGFEPSLCITVSWVVTRCFIQLNYRTDFVIPVGFEPTSNGSKPLILSFKLWNQLKTKNP